MKAKAPPKTGKTYRVEGFETPFPSVTSVISILSKPGIAHWEKGIALESLRTQIERECPIAKDVSEYKETIHNPKWMDKVMLTAKQKSKVELEKAADIGQYAHFLFEELCRGNAVRVNSSYLPLLSGFKDWKKKESDIEIIEVEKFVYSKKYQFAGTVDVIATRKSSPLYSTDERDFIIFDWKTTNNTYNNYALQLAAYAKAYEEMTSLKVVEAHCVRFDKYVPKFYSSQVLDIDSSFQSFLHCLNVYNNMKKNMFLSQKDSVVNDDDLSVDKEFLLDGVEIDDEEKTFTKILPSLPRTNKTWG